MTCLKQQKICSKGFLFEQNNFFSWKTSFRSLLGASSGLRENVSLQSRKAKTVWENVYVYNFDVIWKLY